MADRTHKEVSAEISAQATKLESEADNYQSLADSRRKQAGLLRKTLDSYSVIEAKRVEAAIAAEAEEK